MTLSEVVEVTRIRFQGNIYFSKNELPAGVSLPKEWQEFGVISEDAPKFPTSWQLFANDLPWILSLLDVGLIGTAVVHDSALELLYIFHDANGLYYYTGGLPLGQISTEPAAFCPFKGKILRFYHEVHNGFVFHPAQSMGPQKIEHTSCVADLIDEENAEFASSWVTLLSNGAGDYLAVDIASSNDSEGIIWWHDQPLEPETGVNVFEVMDSWMSTFLEDTQSRDSIIRRHTGS